MPRIPDKCRLLHGPYRPPRLHVGARADCNLRGTVVITSWTDARISWHRCLPVASKGHPSLLLNCELARAVRTEAKAAVIYWWGVAHNVVYRWRKFLDVDRVNKPGTHRLVQATVIVLPRIPSHAVMVHSHGPSPTPGATSCTLQHFTPTLDSCGPWSQSAPTAISQSPRARTLDARSPPSVP